MGRSKGRGEGGSSASATSLSPTLSTTTSSFRRPSQSSPTAQPTDSHLRRIMEPTSSQNFSSSSEATASPSSPLSESLLQPSSLDIEDLTPADFVRHLKLTPGDCDEASQMLSVSEIEVAGQDVSVDSEPSPFSRYSELFTTSLWLFLDRNTVRQAEQNALRALGQPNGKHVEEWHAGGRSSPQADSSFVLFPSSHSLRPLPPASLLFSVPSSSQTSI